jgi:hypothetical protein
MGHRAGATAVPDEHEYRLVEIRRGVARQHLVAPRVTVDECETILVVAVRELELVPDGVPGNLTCLERKRR